MRKIFLLVLGLLLGTPTFAQETINKRIICSIKDFSAASLGMDRIVDASDVGLTETPKELIIPADAKNSDDGNVFSWESEDTKHLYMSNEKVWHLAYTYWGNSRIVSVNAVRVCDEF